MNAYEVYRAHFAGLLAHARERVGDDAEDLLHDIILELGDRETDAVEFHGLVKRYAALRDRDHRWEGKALYGYYQEETGQNATPDRVRMHDRHQQEATRARNERQRRRWEARAGDPKRLCHVMWWLPGDVADELRAVAEHFDTSPSRLLRQAWGLAREELSKLPRRQPGEPR